VSQGSGYHLALLKPSAIFYKTFTIHLKRLFIAESGKYHPVVVLLHNHEWMKKNSKKVSSSLETVQPGMPEVAEGKGCNWLTRGHTP
jgi:hypothetical protein